MDRTVVHGLGKLRWNAHSSNPLTSSSGMRCGSFSGVTLSPTMHGGRRKASLTGSCGGRRVVPVFWGRLSLPRTVAGVNRISATTRFSPRSVRVPGCSR